MERRSYTSFLQKEAVRIAPAASLEEQVPLVSRAEVQVRVVSALWPLAVPQHTKLNKSREA
jgi:hypothetical protein